MEAATSANVEMERSMENRLSVGRTMQTLLLSPDQPLLTTLSAVLHGLNVEAEAACSKERALELVRNGQYDVIVLDWHGGRSAYEILDAIDRSQACCDTVLVGVVAESVEMRQAFAAGVHFLIHKPASVVQIERCLRVAYGSSVGKRRKRHREAVSVAASVRTRKQASAEAVVVNLSETGVGLRLQAADESEGASVAAGEEIDLNFNLPDLEMPVQAKGRVIWTTPSHCGIRFTSMVEGGQLLLERWLSACVERSREKLRARPQEVCA
jgi:CheY-like chemotaxis protein